NGLHVDQREDGTFFFVSWSDGNDVLVIFSRGVGLDMVGFVMGVGFGLFGVVGVAWVHFNIIIVVVAATLEHGAIFLQLIGVIRNQFFRRVIGLVLDSDYFQPEEAAGDIYVRALLVAVLVLLFLARSGIDREAVS